MSERRTLTVDWSVIGAATRFRIPTNRTDREGLAVGDVVTVVGDDVPDVSARVINVSPDDRYVEVELLEANDE